MTIRYSVLLTKHTHYYAVNIKFVNDTSTLHIFMPALCFERSLLSTSRTDDRSKQPIDMDYWILFKNTETISSFPNKC